MQNDEMHSDQRLTEMQDGTGREPLDLEGFRSELHALAEPAKSALREEQQRLGHARAVPVALPFAMLFPSVYLVLRLAGVAWAPPLWVLLILAALPALFVYAAVRARFEREVGEATALACIDDGAHLQDRLSSAREFLAAEVRSPFMLAAIADAQAHSEAARRFVPEPARFGAGRAVRGLHWPVIAVLMLVGTTWLGMPNAAPPAGDSAQAGASGAPESVAHHDTEAPGQRPGALPRPERRADSPRESSSEAQKRGDSGTLDSLRKKSQGEQGIGKSSQAQSSSGQSTGEGQATDQAQPTQGAPKKKSKPRAQKPPKEHAAKKRRKHPKPDKDSVASAGQGKGRGSSRSPTASEWSSKDQSVADDEEELQEEDDVDDEDEESDARGGLQPALRSRKPPVNRDLNIAFGGGPPPPSANGRGGPGLPKKQRGVAQLVLGIPYPDQIAGQPNPGRTKVTQERIEPQPQDAQALEASAREERSTPMGHLSRPTLLPWMQELVRSFQLSIRASLENKPR